MFGIPVTDSITEELGALGFNFSGPPSATVPLGETLTWNSANKSLNMIADPTASDPIAWIILGGHQPQFVSGITNLPSSSTALQNPIGETSQVFTSTLIPIQILKSYRLEMTVRQILDTGSMTFLAVAWYDIGGRLLESNVAGPKGAGHPRGWSNGTFSYFGLLSQAPSTSWTTFGISFGLGHAAAIPAHASFVRVGILLNFNTVPSGVIQFTQARLFEKQAPAIGLAIPESTSVYSVASQTAQLSTHWSPQQVMLDRAGTKEIQAATAIAAPDAVK